METKEQKIDRLKKEIKDYKKFRKSLGKQACIGQSLLDAHSKQIKKLEQELKDLEMGNEIFKRYTENNK